jgi:phosphoribosylformylglycinamidine (FGAM) synthase PurS component
MHEEKVNILNYKGNTIKTMLRVHLSPVRMLSSRKQITINVSYDSEEKKCLHIIGGNVN